jgi:hypothetical protein
MIRASRFLLFGSLLLLVSQNGVSARNYLLWALGLEKSNHGNRRLYRQHYNFKTRERIAETRKERRQGRKHAAEAAPQAGGEQSGSAGGSPKKAGRNYLRAKVAETVAAPAAQAGKPGKSHETRYQRVKERRYEHKYENRQKHKTELGGTTERTFEEGDSSAINRLHNIETDTNREETIEETNTDMAAAKQSTGTGRTKDHPKKTNGHARVNEHHYQRKIDNHKKKQMEKEEAAARASQNNAHVQMKERHYERKFENHEKHKKEKEASAAIATDRTFGGEAAIAIDQTTTSADRSRSGGGRQNTHENAHQRMKDAHYATKLKHHVRDKKDATTGGRSEASRQQNPQHKRGFKKKKQERIHQERAGLPRKPRGHKAPIDKVTMRDGGSATESDPLPISLTLENVGGTVPVVTLYWVVFNSPEACLDQPCTLDDVLNPNTKAAILHGTGSIADDNGDVTLVSSIYRTPTSVNYGGPALIDGLEIETSRAFSSAGFYNTEAEVIVAVRYEPAVEDSSMAQLLELTELVDSDDILDGFSQIATFEAGQTGFGVVINRESETAVEGAVVHLTRQNDVMQAYVETNVAN